MGVNAKPDERDHRLAWDTIDLMSSDRPPQDAVAHQIADIRHEARREGRVAALREVLEVLTEGIRNLHDNAGDNPGLPWAHGVLASLADWIKVKEAGG